VLSLILVLAVGQTAPRGPVAVVIDSKRPGADAFATKVATRLQSALSNQGVDSPLDNDAAVKKLKAAGYSDPRNCQAGTPCLARLAKLLGPKGVVVGVDVAKIGKSLALHLESVGAEGDSIAVVDLNGSTDSWLTELSSQFDTFAKQVSDKVLGSSAQQTPDLKPMAQDKPNDKPVATNLEPTNIPPPPPPPAPEPEKKSNLVPIILGAGAVASFIASGVTLGLGMSNKSALDGSGVGGMKINSTLTLTQAQNYASTGNTEFTVSLITVILGALLAAGSAALFLF